MNAVTSHEKAAPEAVPSGRSTTPRKTAPQSRATWQIEMLPVDSIVPSPYQPRLLFDESELDELIASVRSQGVQQPVLVRSRQQATRNTPVAAANTQGPAASSGYELIAGERRLLACRAANRKTIPVIIRDDLSDAQAAELCLLENVARSNLSAIEEARGYQRLMLDFRLKEERLAKKVGKSVATIREMLKLLQLPEDVQQLLIKRQLSAAHGYQLLHLSASPDVCLSVARYAALHSTSAASLGRELLPNARELKRAGLVAEMEWNTKFDWKSVCTECPHKALVKSGYGSYCLLPEEWKRKQLEAIALQQDENARALEEARRVADNRAGEGSGDETAARDANEVPCLSQLPAGSYRNLSSGEVPSGCSQSCSCRGLARTGEGNDEIITICLDPQRYRDLLQTDRERKEADRQQEYEARFTKALTALREQWQAGDTAPATALILLPFLQANIGGVGYLQPGTWENLVQGVGQDLGLDLPWAQLLDPEEERTEDDQLHLLVAALTASITNCAPATRVEQETSTPQGKPDVSVSLLLCAGLLLALESLSAARWGGDTPQLDFVLAGMNRQMAIELAPTPEDAAPEPLPESFANEEYADSYAADETCPYNGEADFLAPLPVGAS